jgi:hypothetical protein
MNGVLLLALTLVLLVACGAITEPTTQTLELPAADLVRRNLFKLSNDFAVGEAMAYQYGNVHVDGPTGGMLYRFVTTPAAVVWLEAEWSLDRIAIESTDDLELDFLPQTPQWWIPTRTAVDAYYFGAEEFPPRGRRTLTMIFDEETGVLYVVEHYDNMVGI